MSAHEYPWGADLVALTPSADGTAVVLTCALCGTGIGNARYLNEAINRWREHQAKERKDA